MSDQRDKSQKNDLQLGEQTASKPQRRKALAVGAVGMVAWKTPLLNAIVTPAHAQMSVTTTTTTLAPIMNQVVTMAAAGVSNLTLEFPAAP